MELLYLVLVGVIISEVFVFILLSLPSPPGFKGSIAELLARSRKTQIFLLTHLSFCLIAGLLFADCYRMEEKYRAQRDFLIQAKNVGTDIRIAELSYKMLLVQRNKYIAFMTIFVAIFLNIYITLLRYMYSTRDSFDLIRSEAEKRRSSTAAVVEEAQRKEEIKEDVKKIL